MLQSRLRGPRPHDHCLRAAPSSSTVRTPTLHTALVVEGGECAAVPMKTSSPTADSPTRRRNRLWLWTSERCTCSLHPIATLPEAAALAPHANPRVTSTMYAGLSDPARAGLAAKLAEAFGA